MGDAATNLRQTLSQTNLSQPTIQSSAASMMRLYNTSTTLAVSEWRSALQSCRNDQLLPLLYVCNEVLQTSKRNRGPKFLEAFGEVLAQSLRFICERDGTVVEKVRRTVKIWGDRRVYSTRFVGELLKGLEDLRGGGRTSAVPSSGTVGASASAAASASPGGGGPAAATASAATSATGSSGGSAEKKRSVTDDESDADGDNGGDNAFSSPFGSGPSQPLLSVDVTVAATAASSSAAAASSSSGGTKRRRSSTTPADSSDAGGGAAGRPGGKKSKSSSDGDNNNNRAKKKKQQRSNRKKAPPKKTNSTLVTNLESLSNLGDRYRSSRGTLDSLHPSHFDDTPTGISDVVGDELIDLNRGAAAAARTLGRQRKVMHGIAVERKRLEKEVEGYIGWLDGCLKVDEEELAFCDRVEAKLETLRVVHAEAKAAREKRLDEEAKQRALEAADLRRKKEEDDRKRALEEAMAAKNTEAKPGMVWDKVLREYRYIGDAAEESWRD